MAKAKHATKLRPSSKKEGGLAANRRRRRKRSVTVTKTTREVVSNPPLGQDFVNVLLPGFAAYGVTRVLQRIVYTLVQRRWPSLGKHASAIAGAAAFGGVWFLGHRVKKLAKYHDGIVLGSGIAALHGVATCYLPDKYTWLLTDCRPEDVTPAPQLPAPSATAPATTAAPTSGDEYSYLESQLEQIEHSGSRRARTIPAPKPTAKPVAAALQMADDGGNADLDPDLASELVGEDVDDLYSGSFSNNN